MRKAFLLAALTIFLITPSVHAADHDTQGRYYLRLDALLATGLSEMSFGGGYFTSYNVTTDLGLGATAVAGVEGRRGRLELGVTWLGLQYSNEIREWDYYGDGNDLPIRHRSGLGNTINVHLAMLFATTPHKGCGWVLGPLLGWKVGGSDFFDGSGLIYGLRLGYTFPKGKRNQIEVGLQYFNMPTKYSYHNQGEEFSFLAAQVGLRFGLKE